MSHFPRLAILLLLAAVTFGCTARGTMEFGATAPGATLRQIFVATERSEENRRSENDWGGDRAPALQFIETQVSIPPVHQTGEIEWAPKNAANGAEHFVLTRRADLPSISAMADRIRAARQPGATQTLIYVHGYNINNAEAVYRLAQIAHDFETPLPVLLYSWPSAGRAGGYAYDRDSVIYTRDGLEQVIRALTARSSDTVVVLAHSMGSQLVMEVLRQIAIAGDQAVLDKIDAVVMIAPDIDDEVFVRQAERIERLPDPFVIFSNTEDKALNFSALLTGKRARLGTIRNSEALNKLPVRVVDFSQFARRRGTNHMVPVTSPAAIAFLRRLLETGAIAELSTDRVTVAEIEAE